MSWLARPMLAVGGWCACFAGWRCGGCTRCCGARWTAGLWELADLGVVAVDVGEIVGAAALAAVWCRGAPGLLPLVVSHFHVLPDVSAAAMAR
ncbi:MAG: hypothetical protein R3E31_12830 [Chloroflexota bacterium]